MDTVTTPPVSSRGGDLMGKGDHAHLSISSHPSRSSRKGLSSDDANAHPPSPYTYSFPLQEEGSSHGHRRWMGMVTTPPLSPLASLSILAPPPPLVEKEISSDQSQCPSPHPFPCPFPLQKEDSGHGHRRWMDMATTTPFSSRGFDLMGKGGYAHLSTLVHISHSSRKGLAGDYANAHLHAPTCLPSL